MEDQNVYGKEYEENDLKENVSPESSTEEADDDK